MGVEKLLNGSPYGLATVRIWLCCAQITVTRNTMLLCGIMTSSWPMEPRRLLDYMWSEIFPQGFYLQVVDLL
jgi:hypothetical protein